MMRIMIPPQANDNNIKVPAEAILNTSKAQKPSRGRGSPDPAGELIFPYWWGRG